MYCEHRLDAPAGDADAALLNELESSAGSAAACLLKPNPKFPISHTVVVLE